MYYYVRGLGKKLKRERELWGMSRRRLAKLCHVEVEDILDIETGKNKTPSFSLILEICEVLDISAFTFLTDFGQENFNDIL